MLLQQIGVHTSEKIAIVTDYVYQVEDLLSGTKNDVHGTRMNVYTY